MNALVPLRISSEHIAGVDEAGRGCLAGPVVAAAVILPDNFFLPGLNDSKKLSPQKREKIAVEIKAQAKAWAVGLAWPKEIDRINILQATLVAMTRAVKNLKRPPGFLLIDGNQTIPLDVAQKAIVGGDAQVPSISAASILAKTFRDHLMFHLDRRYPGYGFAKHKGYGTKEHRLAIKRLGPSPIHRKTFKGVLRHREEKRLCLPNI
ncbi:ribonuclease HII [Desulfohalobiaceae bacterium Ax17]|uniref:ribonuclease HII n=1 Tax=Desulfovulcanus ferrireducens TaxID=2831190 RepID=UPI00207BBE02|nr:ribonuclease HII [Desulfovulcanus ferrireducens]